MHLSPKGIVAVSQYRKVGVNFTLTGGPIRARLLSGIGDLRYVCCMVRQARLDAPGVLHHVMARSIERRPIFKVVDDMIETAKRKFQMDLFLRDT